MGFIASTAGEAGCEDARPPRWVGELAGADTPVVWFAGGAAAAAHGARYSVLSAAVEAAAAMADDALEAAVVAAYRAIAAELARVRRHPVRYWNHVPDITAPAGGGRDRYMVFNAGRYRAMLEDCDGSPVLMERRVATASGIGTRGADLVIHCLASDAPGAAVNNPRQVAPYHYSRRFGPLPPCFSRATLLERDGLLLVGGTASVRGEDSLFRHDLSRQLGETFFNLGAVVASATGGGGGGGGGGRVAPGDPAQLLANLSAYRDLRVYLPRAGDAAEVAAAVRAHCPNVRRLETVPAALCRPELLVEIEGVAEVGGRKDEG